MQANKSLVTMPQMAHVATGELIVFLSRKLVGKLPACTHTAQGPEEMCLSLEHQNPSKTSKKMGYFDRVTVSLHILWTANQENEGSQALRATCCAPARIWLAVIDFQNGEQQSRSRSDKKRRNRLQWIHKNPIRLINRAKRQV